MITSFSPLSYRGKFVCKQYHAIHVFKCYHYMNCTDINCM
ncbi:hypothetical protein F383_26063 [Gossypium arboreum]|uniref:Uncharacterized protein n=1 Tax=Gossypium arboreum TaxID=29729 RepID=A0A0B0P1F8_GOSAR|nr:hypothetical protein F383_26063 [Gossypium arboreum]